MSTTDHRSQMWVMRFFALAFAISWIPGLVVAAILQALLPESMDRASLLLAKYGPTLAGIAMAIAVSGREGLAFLLRSAVRVRAHVLAYAVALLVPPLAWLGALKLFELSSGQVAWTFLDAVTADAILAALATFTFLGGGFGEELA